MLLAGMRSTQAMAFAKLKSLPIGLQLYSVREACAKDLPGVIEKVAKMGYQGVEFAGYYDRTAKQLRKMLDDNGLKCCGSHLKLDVLLGDALKETVEFNRTLGNKYLIVAWMAPSYTESVAAVKAKAEAFNEIADRIKPQGMRVGYHAHAHDFKQIGKETAWDLLFENTNRNVVMQLDLGNCVEGGGDPLAVLKRFPGRSATVHLKETGGKPDAVLGEGDIDWKTVLRLLETTGGTQWLIIEHERPAGDPLQNVDRCLRNLKKLDV